MIRTLRNPDTKRQICVVETPEERDAKLAARIWHHAKHRKIRRDPVHLAQCLPLDAIASANQARDLDGKVIRRKRRK